MAEGENPREGPSANIRSPSATGGDDKTLLMEFAREKPVLCFISRGS